MSPIIMYFVLTNDLFVFVKKLFHLSNNLIANFKKQN